MSTNQVSASENSGADAEGAPAALSAGAPCCASAIYWCPRVGEFECPTHGGHTTCCNRPERHTPLARFETQTKALLKWWRGERADTCGLCVQPQIVERPMPTPDFHPECGLRSVLGGIGHLTNHPYWCRQMNDPDAGHDWRTSSLLVAKWVELNGIEAAHRTGHQDEERKVRAGKFADLPRKVAHREQQIGNQYLSTACIHEHHDQCDAECVYCNDGCACPCHPWNQTPAGGDNEDRDTMADHPPTSPTGPDQGEDPAHGTAP